MAEPIVITEYDARWPATFEAVEARIRNALGSKALQIEHVGSTSVPGLAAKPVIDVDVVVADSAHEAAYVPALEDFGFALRVREPQWHEHRMLRGEDPPVNLHVFSPDCPEVIRHVMFRDWLREHPDDRASYAEIKRAAAAETTSAGGVVMDYNRRKEAVVREIYDRMFTAHGLR
nr:GrpB family protein [Epidermidibacterium keratini]